MVRRLHQQLRRTALMRWHFAVLWRLHVMVLLLLLLVLLLLLLVHATILLPLVGGDDVLRIVAGQEGLTQRQKRIRTVVFGDDRIGELAERDALGEHLRWRLRWRLLSIAGAATAGAASARTALRIEVDVDDVGRVRFAVVVQCRWRLGGLRCGRRRRRRLL